ncbi:hypothetical protein FRC06_003695 [Ceratobasidium sp. 370]|nr:hypothetical protein FRC06_003695 [Ceratobasidium sp. 370]
MPVPAVVEVLPAWTAQNSETLESLVIICKSTTALNDSTLCKMAPSLRGLRRLHLAGCVKITERSINEVLSNNAAGLESLALESCSPYFSMSVFGTYCSEHQYLTSLSSISLTLPYFKDSTQRERWIGDVLFMLQHSPIESFQLYAGGSLEDEVSYATINFESLKRLADGHLTTLRRIGIQRLIIPVEALSYAVSVCPRLEEVFTTLRDVNRDELAQALVPGKALRNVHTTLMRDVAGSLRPLHLSTSQDIYTSVEGGKALRRRTNDGVSWVLFRPADSRTVFDYESLEVTGGPVMVRLGNSGLKVSRIILGLMSYGSPEWLKWVLEEEEGIKHIKAAYDAGTQTFDTANAYSNGKSERILGKAIRQLNLPRDEIVLMTKMFGVVCRTPGGRYFGGGADQAVCVNQHGLGRRVGYANGPPAP